MWNLNIVTGYQFHMNPYYFLLVRNIEQICSKFHHQTHIHFEKWAFSGLMLIQQKTILVDIF